MSKTLIAIPVLLALVFPAAHSQNATPVHSVQRSPASAKPRVRSDEEVQKFFRNARSAHFAASPKVPNPRAAEARNPAILQALKAQKMAAGSVPAHAMDATGASSNSQNPAGAASAPPANTGPTPGLAGNTPNGRSSNLSRPGNTAVPGMPPNHARLAMLTAPAPLRNICPPGPGPGVFSVNGKPRGAIFTQDPNGNEYTIVGCRFGNSRGEVHLEGGFRAGTVPLVIESWSDTVIKAKMNPALTGEPDQSNVSLVVVPIGSPGLTRVPGFTFYAVREVSTLHSFPQSGVTLRAITATDGQAVPANFSSPYSGNTPAASFTAGVERNHHARFDPGTDIWDLSGLAPGFEPLDFQLSHWATEDCGTKVLPADETIYNDGRWDARWDPRNSKRIVVNFAEQHCHESPSMMQLGDDQSNSTYALTITVIGPKGVSPW
jgi:hypothetical protein